MENSLIKIILCINSLITLIVVAAVCYIVFNFNQVFNEIHEEIRTSQEEAIKMLDDTLNERTYARYPIEKL